MKKSFLKTGITQITQTVSEETGEILDVTTNNSLYLANTKEQFYLMYSSMVLILKQSSDTKMKLFAALLERYSSGQEFAMNGGLKIIIASETNCNSRSLDNAFTFLIKENIVVKINKGLYRINPRHIFQSSSLDRNNNLKAVLTICKNC